MGSTLPEILTASATVGLVVGGLVATYVKLVVAAQLSAFKSELNELMEHKFVTRRELNILFERRVHSDDGRADDKTR